MRIKRILVPIDFSSSSLRALEVAVDFAEPFDSELLLLFVTEPIVYVVPDYAGAQSAALAEALDQQQRVARAELARLEQRYAARGITLHALLQTGRAAQTSVETAAKRQVDLIVMATHGRTGVSRLMMGSVAERVVRSAPCPVLTMHAVDGQRSGRRPRQPARGR